MRDATSPDEPVLVWGFESMIAYLANRRPVSRFGFHYPLTSCLWPWLDVPAELKGLCQMYRVEMIAEFQKNPPVLVAVAFDDVNLMLRSSRVELKQFPERTNSSSTNR
jgi:hypothetical protein